MPTSHDCSNAVLGADGVLEHDKTEHILTLAVMSWCCQRIARHRQVVYHLFCLLHAYHLLLVIDVAYTCGRVLASNTKHAASIVRSSIAACVAS